MTYVLGYQDETNKKAEKGTVTHKVLECLALLKLAVQNNKKYITDDVLGKYKFNHEDLLTSTKLTDDLVDSINKERSYKSKYTWPCTIKYNHVRHGVDIVYDIFNIVYDYYSSRSKHEWSKTDKKDCWHWIWIPLDLRNGLYDPRKREIYSPEQKFDITLDFDWAKYEYEHEGKIISGQLALKGTIDLITRLDERTLEIIDWKSGQRKNWATGDVKTLEYLHNDHQLMLYYYALHKLIKDHDIMMTIYYNRCGGPFTPVFEHSHLKKMEKYLQKRFETIKKNSLPKLCHPEQKDIKCSWCSFYKNKFANDNMNMCNRIHEEIKSQGIEEVVEQYKVKDHKFDKYSCPGE